jgi:hypothetical protein
MKTNSILDSFFWITARAGSRSVGLLYNWFSIWRKVFTSERSADLACASSTLVGGHLYPLLRWLRQLRP